MILFTKIFHNFYSGIQRAGIFLTGFKPRSIFLRDKPDLLKSPKAKDINTLTLPRHHSPNPQSRREKYDGYYRNLLGNKRGTPSPSANALSRSCSSLPDTSVHLSPSGRNQGSVRMAAARLLARVSRQCAGAVAASSAAGRHRGALAAAPVEQFAGSLSVRVRFLDHLLWPMVCEFRVFW